MRVIVGTSGYSYKEWKGTFYPDDLPASKMLPFYARNFGAVEINNTFYRMPTESLIKKWESEVPEGFTFVLKAPAWIESRASAEVVGKFFDVASALGSKLGPALFRRHKTDGLREFLALVPKERRVCVEFREVSIDEDVLSALREHDAALCIADTDDVEDPDSLLIATASWGYLRLRRTDYSKKQLAAWAKRIAAQQWSHAYVFFKHEDEGKGPVFAKRFLALLGNDSR
ncbi:MAG TPA: DUF72 domain-containing protein [Thermoanaerobaculia bacterium]|nr:DUF72 domain-containing protein [Thermoanaerobaculia bacterium]